ncbi:hypothetical protein THAOC_11108, partial [Thalassiosira oceanica]
MRQSGCDSDSEDSNCIYWDQKGLGTGPDVYLHRFGGGFPGPPLASMSQSLLKAGSSSDDSSCGSEDSKCKGDSERTPPGNRSGNRGRKRKSTNLLCGEDESPATIGNFQRGRSQNYCDSIVRLTHSNAIFSTTDGSTKPATVAGPQMSATVLEDEFGNEEKEWDLTKIDQSVARALAGQSHLSHRVIQVANYSSPPKQTSTANTSSDLSDYNEDIFFSTKPEEFAAIDERVKLQ